MQNKKCSVCGTLDTRKWYKDPNQTGAFLCQSHYRALNYQRTKHAKESKESHPNLRPIEYKGKVCWQYYRKKYFEKADKDFMWMAGLSPLDFTINKEPLSNEIRRFIEKYEWLGKMPARFSRVYTARYDGTLAGVMVMSPPYGPDESLGFAGRELVLTRGAVASFAPKYLNSHLVMAAIRDTAKNTEYKFFLGYGDIEARELGTIYQACNFLYLGQKYGASKQFLHKDFPETGWFTSRRTNNPSFVRAIVGRAGIEWEPTWHIGHTIIWVRIPEDMQKTIKKLVKEYVQACEVRHQAPKHKYVQICGANRAETRLLVKQFMKDNKNAIRPYPKRRGE